MTLGAGMPVGSSIHLRPGGTHAIVLPTFKQNQKSKWHITQHSVPGAFQTCFRRAGVPSIYFLYFYLFGVSLKKWPQMINVFPSFASSLFFLLPLYPACLWLPSGFHQLPSLEKPLQAHLVAHGVVSLYRFSWQVTSLWAMESLHFSSHLQWGIRCTIKGTRFKCGLRSFACTCVTTAPERYLIPQPLRS